MKAFQQKNNNKKEEGTLIQNCRVWNMDMYEGLPYMDYHIGHNQLLFIDWNCILASCNCITTL